MGEYEEFSPFDEEEMSFGEDVSMSEFIHDAETPEDDPHVGDGIHGPVCQGCHFEFGPNDDDYVQCDKCCAVLCQDCAIPVVTENDEFVSLCEHCHEEAEDEA